MNAQPTVTVPLFRTSLRSWQARFKAARAEAGQPTAAPTEVTPRRLPVPRKRRQAQGSETTAS